MEEAITSRRFGNWISRSKTKNSGTTAEASSAGAGADDVANDLKNRSSNNGRRAKAVGGRVRAGSTDAKILEDLEAETESPTDDSASTVGDRQPKVPAASSSSSSKMNTSASAIVYTSPPGKKNKMSIATQTPKSTKSLGSRQQVDLLDLPNWEHPSPAPPIKSPVRVSGSRRKSSSEKKTKKSHPGKEGNQLDAEATDHSEAFSASVSSVADDDDDASYVSTGTTQSTQSKSMRIPSLRSLGSSGSKKSKSSTRSTKSSRINRDADNDDASQCSRSSSSRLSRRDGNRSQHSQNSSRRPMFDLDTDSEDDISMNEFFSGYGVQEPPASPKVYSEITLQITNLSASASILIPTDLEFGPMDDPTTISPKRDKRSNKPSRGDGEDARLDKSTHKDNRESSPRRFRQSSFKAPPTLDSSADTLDSSITEQGQRKGALQASIHRPRRGSKKNDPASVLPNSLDFSTSLSSLELLSVDTDDDQRTSDDGGCSMDGVDITKMTAEQLAELEEKMLKTAMENSLNGSQLDVSASEPTPLMGGKRPNRKAPPSLTSNARPSRILSSFDNSSCASLDLRDIAGDEDPSLGAMDDDIVTENSLANMSPEELANLEEKMLKMAMQQSLNGISGDATGGGGGGVGASPIQMSATEAYDRKMASFNQSSQSTRMPPSAIPTSPARRLPLTTPLPAPSPARASNEIHSPRVRAELISPVNNRPRQHMGSSPARYNTGVAPTSQQSPRHSSRSATPSTGPTYSDRHNGSGSYHQSPERSSGGSRMAVIPAPLLYGSDRIHATAHISSGSSVCSYGSIDSSATDPDTATRLAEIEQEDVLVEMAIQESLREAESSGRSHRSSVPYDSFSTSSRSVGPGKERPSAPPTNISCNNNQYLGRSMFPSSSPSDDESEDDELDLADAPLMTTSIPMSNPNPSPRCRAQSADCFDNSRMQAKARRPARLDSYVKFRPSDKAMI